jgi:hypothetical protein
MHNKATEHFTVAHGRFGDSIVMRCGTLAPVPRHSHVDK